MFGNSNTLASEEKCKTVFWQSKDDEDIMATVTCCGWLGHCEQLQV